MVVSTESRKPNTAGFLERIIAGVIFIFPITGAFSPIEEYFDLNIAARNFYTAVYAPPTPFGVSSLIHITTLVLLFVLSLANWRGMWRQARLMLPILVLFGWMVASALWSIDPINTLRRALHMVDQIVFAAYLVQRFSWREIISLFTQCYIVIFIMSVVMATAFPDFGLSTLTGYADAWRGVFTEKNTLGAVAVMGVLISGYSLIHGINQRWLAALVCLGQLLLLVMSRSATSGVSLLLILGLTTLALGVSIHERPVIRFFSLMVLLVGAICGLLLFCTYDSIHEMTGRSASLTGRTEVWHYVIELIQARPWLGYGYGFWLAPSLQRLNMWLAINWPMPHAHDEWLDVTLQLGLVGLCIEVFCLALALTRAVRLSFILQDGKALFCGLLIVILCVRGYTETVLTDPAINGWLWLVIGYLPLAHMTKENAA